MSNKPIAYVSGTHAGRTVIRYIDPSLVLAQGTALYIHPAEPVEQEPVVCATDHCENHKQKGGFKGISMNERDIAAMEAAFDDHPTAYYHFGFYDGFKAGFAHRDSQTQEVIQAVENLIKVKGRFHTEQAMNKLIETFGQYRKNA